MEKELGRVSLGVAAAEGMWATVTCSCCCCSRSSFSVESLRERESFLGDERGEEADTDLVRCALFEGDVAELVPAESDGGVDAADAGDDSSGGCW